MLTVSSWARAMPLALPLVLCTALGHAQTTGDLDAARNLAAEGFQAQKDGRYQEAADKLGEAYQTVRVPTLALGRARALVKLGL
ncbi:hypothetical protein ACFL5O_11450 [Myxococcota bacterium]